MALATKIDEIFPVCRKILGHEGWQLFIKECGENPSPDIFLAALESHAKKMGLPAYLTDLGRLEYAVYKVRDVGMGFPSSVSQLTLNPSLNILEFTWKGLANMLDLADSTVSRPVSGHELIQVWLDPETRETKTGVADDASLLAVKMLIEEIDPALLAEKEGVSVGTLDGIIDMAVRKGILLRPKSLIRRDPDTFPLGKELYKEFVSSPNFTLQWHITQACDLNCKHCYDRSDRFPLSLDKAITILDSMYMFCKSKHVAGEITFTGGNPLLYPHFYELYKATAERGFSTAILGNPARSKQIKKILSIQEPDFIQVSLEGLPQHNDSIRGKGHFKRTIGFLKILKDLGVYSMVMLTLTRDNLDQVLPLIQILRGHCDAFFFNRLSLVGRGAELQLPDPDAYSLFLDAYTKIAEDDPMVGLKDNLFNIIKHQTGMKPFGGCTGYGCGAAFNFLVVLSDGEAHACRKFPSKLGNIFEQSLEAIYNSPRASLFRQGCSACFSCDIRPVCGGCLAIAHSFDLDVFTQKDPFCFIGSNPI
jgi:selenobiotic family peptide radical SAM maturase